MSSARGEEGHDAGVVDDDVDVAVGGEGEVGEGFHVVEAGDVEGAVFGVSAGGADFVGEGVEAVGAAGSEDDFVAEAGEVACGGFSDAAAGSGDEDDFIAHGGNLANTREFRHTQNSG